MRCFSPWILALAGPFLVGCQSTDITAPFPAAVTVPGAPLPGPEFARMTKRFVFAETHFYTLRQRDLGPEADFAQSTLRVLAAADGERLRRLLASRATESPHNITVAMRFDQTGDMARTRDLVYPVEFDRPQIKTATGEVISLTAENFERASQEAIAATPATPTNFESRELGPHGRWRPQLEPDGRIKMDLELTNHSFHGFVNYGAPIKRGKVILTENLILQPILQTVKLTTSVIVERDQFLLIGPLRTSEDVDAKPISPDSVSGVEQANGLYLLTQVRLDR